MNYKEAAFEHFGNRIPGPFEWEIWFIKRYNFHTFALASFIYYIMQYIYALHI